MAELQIDTRARGRFLNVVEKLGDALPDPVFIFIGLIGVLVAVSVVGSNLGWAAVNPITGETLTAKSLLSEDNVRKLFTEMARTYAGFTPLGVALTVVIGAGVADRSGLFATLLRASLRGVPLAVLTPAVFVIGMLTTHAVDAGYLVYVPLAGVVFAAAGRHPVLGVVVGFAGAAVGLSGNLFPGQYDMLIFGITEPAARLIAPDWTMNPLGNWWFGIGIAVVFTSLGWYIAERVVSPRLGPWENGAPVDSAAATAISPIERRGLRAAGLAALSVAALFAALIFWPGYSPLHDDTAVGTQRIVPIFQSLVGVIFMLFLSTGWAYGATVGSIRSHRDVVNMMAEGLTSMIPYLVLIFFAAHFVAMFG